MIHPGLAHLATLIDLLKPYPGNARRGSVAAIMESLETNGQYRPIVVQRSTGFVLAGNHTVLAARQLGWAQVAAWFVDVDDDTARRIVLADNRLADRGWYDEDALLEVLESLPTLAGTGFDRGALERLAGDLAADRAVTPPENRRRFATVGDLRIAWLESTVAPWADSAKAVARGRGGGIRGELRRRLGLPELPPDGAHLLGDAGS